MQYSQLVNAIATAMSNDARVFTRYNYAAVAHEDGANGTAITRDAKFVVVDYKGSNASYAVKIMQVGNATVVPTKEAVFERMTKEDPNLFQIERQEEASEMGPYISAALVSGLHAHEPGAASIFIRDLAKIVASSEAKGRGPTLVCVSRALCNNELHPFGNEFVAFFVQLEDMVVVIQIKE